jgi:hypothetical protein
MEQIIVNNFQEKTFSVTLALSAATYAAGDVITTTQEIPLKSYLHPDVSYLRGRITYLRVLDEDDQGISMDVFFFKNNVSLGTVDSAISISDADAREIVGIINVTTYTDLINSRQAEPDFKDIPFVLDSTEKSLFVSACTRGTPTYTATGVRLLVTVQFGNQLADYGS